MNGGRKFGGEDLCDPLEEGRVQGVCYRAGMMRLGIGFEKVRTNDQPNYFSGRGSVCTS